MGTGKRAEFVVQILFNLVRIITYKFLTYFLFRKNVLPGETMFVRIRAVFGSLGMP